MISTNLHATGAHSKVDTQPVICTVATKAENAHTVVHTCQYHVHLQPLHLAAWHCELTAAVLLPGQGYAKSKEGFELHMATNYLGPFLLTLLLLPALQRSGTLVRAAHATSSTPFAQHLLSF